MKQITIVAILIMTLSLENNLAAVAEMPYETKNHGSATLLITIDTGVRALVLEDGTELALCSDFYIGRHYITSVFCAPECVLHQKTILEIITDLNSSDALENLEKLRSLDPPLPASLS